MSPVCQDAECLNSHGVEHVTGWQVADVANLADFLSEATGTKFPGT